MSFICPVCKQAHDELSDIGANAPYYWKERFADDPHSLLTEDLCIIERRDYFVRGVIEIPVHDYEHHFGWGVWVSHKKENFETYRDHFDTPEIGPYFGWLSTEIAFYEEPTLNLKTMTHDRGDGLRPLIILEPSDHPLARHQREGISFAQAWEIATVT